TKSAYDHAWKSLGRVEKMNVGWKPSSGVTVIVTASRFSRMCRPLEIVQTCSGTKKDSRFGSISWLGIFETVEPEKLLATSNRLQMSSSLGRQTCTSSLSANSDSVALTKIPSGMNCNG